MAGCIIRVSGEEFLKKFAVKEDVDNYEFLLVSSDINTTGQFKNVMLLNQLIPSSKELQFILDKEKKQYKKACQRFYRQQGPRQYVTILVLSAITKGMNIVLLCSEEEEKDYKYLKELCRFIESEYEGISTYTYKEYVDCREKDEFKELKNEDKIKAQLEKEIAEIKKRNEKDEKNKKKKLKEAMDNIKKLGKKDLKKICKAKGWKGYKKVEEDKKELLKFVEKKLYKELIE